jgi:hypothetical protein
VLFIFVSDPQIVLEAELCESILLYKGLCTISIYIILFLSLLDPTRELACIRYYLRGQAVLIYVLVVYRVTALFRARARPVSY